MQPPRTWFNRNLPQTLYLAHLLLYIQGAIWVLFLLSYGDRIVGLSGADAFSLRLIIWLFAGPGSIIAALGIANLRPWGYRLGLVVAVLPLLLRVVYAASDLAARELIRAPVDLMFDVALVAFLLHTQSRKYVRFWSR